MENRPKGAKYLDEVKAALPGVPNANLVSGRMAGGRVTAWAITCEQCAALPGAPSLVINPTTKAKAAQALRDHYAAHREGRL